MMDSMSVVTASARPEGDEKAATFPGTCSELVLR